jgi:hypothetical protein
MDIKTTTIEKLMSSEELDSSELIPISQKDVTKKTTVESVGGLFLSKANEYTDDAVKVEAQERIKGDTDTLTASRAYTDNSLLARNEWLSPVNTLAELQQKTDLNNKQNYLCKVVADEKNGVYQCVAGWTDTPVWRLYDDTVDFVNEKELADAIDNHDKDETAHEGIRNAITQETEKREASENELEEMIIVESNERKNADTALAQVIAGEIEARKEADNSLNEKIETEKQEREAAINVHNDDVNSHKITLTNAAASNILKTAGNDTITNWLQSFRNNIKYLLLNMKPVDPNNPTDPEDPDDPTDPSEPELLTGTVSITGNAIVGQTLLSDVSQLDGAGEILYQWRRGSSDIVGATSYNYIISTEDIGYNITLEVTRIGYVGTKISNTLGVVTAPQLTGAVTITGTTIRGYVLAANTTSLDGEGEISYQWKRGGANIAGANSATYLLTASEVGYTITVTVTREGFQGSVTSPVTSTIINPALTGSVSIVGTGTIGQTLTANTGSVAGTGTLSYQWRRNGANISGATGATYVLQTADVGTSITVYVTRSGYTGGLTSSGVTIINLAFPNVNSVQTVVLNAQMSGSGGGSGGGGGGVKGGGALGVAAGGFIQGNNYPLFQATSEVVSGTSVARSLRWGAEAPQALVNGLTVLARSFGRSIDLLESIWSTVPGTWRLEEWILVTNPANLNAQPQCITGDEGTFTQLQDRGRLTAPNAGIPMRFMAKMRRIA